MRRARDVTLGTTVALALASAAGLCALRPPQPAVRLPRALHTTIEPTLPLAIDLNLVSVTEAGDGGSASLEISLATDPAIRDLEIALRLPEEVQAMDTAVLRGLGTHLASGERQRCVIPLRALRRGVFPVRVEASYRLEDGRTFRAGQGSTLRLGVPEPAGRISAGAYEFPAVPAEELRR